MSLISDLIFQRTPLFWVFVPAWRICIFSANLDKEFAKSSESGKKDPNGLAPLVRSERREDVVRFLTSAPTNLPRPRSGSIIYIVFNLWFGENHWTWLCFRRSCFSSTIFIISVVGLLVDKTVWNYAWEESLKMLIVQTGVIGLSIIVSVVQDYFSLLKGRFILRGLANSMRDRNGVACVFLDIFFSAIIGILFGSIATVFIVFFLQFALNHDCAGLVLIDRMVGTFQSVLSLPFKVFTSSSDDLYLADIVESAAVYSTLFTSVWAILFAAAALSFRALSQFRYALLILRFLFDVEQRPMSALGALVAVGWIFLSSLIVMLCHSVAGAR